MTPEARAYHAAWRRSHRETENARKRRLRAQPGWRAIHEPDRRHRGAWPIPAPFLGHPLFEMAREIVGPNRSGLTVFRDPLHEDLLSVAVVALVEGTDPVAAVARFRSAEGAWRRITTPFLMEDIAA